MDYIPDLLTLSRDLREAGVPAWPYQRAADRGRLLRIHHGVYAPTAAWAKLTETERYSHRVLGCVIQSRSSPIDLARTVVEVAADCAFTTAVGIADWALSQESITKDSLRQMLDALAITRGRSKAIKVIDFADGRSGSPGESLSRVRMHEAGFPSPVLQQRFDDADGLAGIVDFWWPDHDLIGEFDGVSKYVREEIARGKDIAQIVLDEKWREDRLRACGPRVTRWDWSTAWTEYGLYAHLLKAGLPSTKRTGVSVPPRGA
jgi:hypothetical protein